MSIIISHLSCIAIEQSTILYLDFFWQMSTLTFFFIEYFVVALANYAYEEFEVASLESPQYGGAAVHCFQFVYDFYVSLARVALK